MVLASVAGIDCSLRLLGTARGALSHPLVAVALCCLTGTLVYGTVKRSPELVETSWRTIGFGRQYRGYEGFIHVLPKRNQAIAEMIKRESSPQDEVYQWGWNYDIPYLAERRSP